MQTEIEDTRKFYPCTVTIACEEGPADVPGLTSPKVPGLAAIMPNFGTFNVTHLESGRSLSGIYERYGSALLVLAEFAAIGHAYGIDYTRDGAEVAAALKAVKDKPVPFGGATNTDADGDRPLTVWEWLQFTRTDDMGDEFPWESPDEAPDQKAFALFDTLPDPADAPPEQDLLS